MDNLSPLLAAKAQVLLDFVGAGLPLNYDLYGTIKRRFGIGKADADRIINNLQVAGHLQIDTAGGSIVLRRVAQ